MAYLTLGYLTLDAPPVDTIEAAANSGFRSVGIRITGRRVADPYTQVVGNPATIREIRTKLRETGLRLSNVSAYHFYPDVSADDLSRVLDAASELGTGIIVANSYIEDADRFLELFVPYAAVAGARGIRIAIEFMRYSAIKSLAEADRLMLSSGQASAGLLIDPLHLARAGETASAIAKVPPERIIFCQLCDAPALTATPSLDELRHEARTGRLHPGEGNLPLYDFLDALPADVEIEVEVPRPETKHLPLAERAKVARARAMEFLDGYRASRKSATTWS